jgi:hypothetical protein
MNPLPTDEKLAKRAPRERDMDTHMLFGCSGFVLSSFVSYGLAVWPFFVWMDAHVLASLALAMAAGLPAAYIFGAVVSRKFGIAGAAGFIGGMVSTSIFLYLRFEQVFLEADAQRIPPPEYPTWFQWFLPMLCLSFAILLASAIVVFAPGKADRPN